MKICNLWFRKTLLNYSLYLGIILLKIIDVLLLFLYIACFFWGVGGNTLQYSQLRDLSCWRLEDHMWCWWCCWLSTIGPLLRQAPYQLYWWVILNNNYVSSSFFRHTGSRPKTSVPQRRVLWSVRSRSVVQHTKQAWKLVIHYFVHAWNYLTNKEENFRNEGQSIIVALNFLSSFLLLWFGPFLFYSMCITGRITQLLEHSFSCYLPGDVLANINGISTEGFTHKQVVDLIRSSGNLLR